MSYSVASRASRHNDTVLVIDDDIDIINLMVSILASSDYQVLFASDAGKGLLIARQERPDIVLLDIMMPEMDGFDVVAELKAHPDTEHIPVIFTSPLSGLESKVKAFDMGGVDYIAMPFHPAEAIARIKTHISLQKAQNELYQKNGELSKEIETRKQAEAQLERRVQDLLFLNTVTENVTRATELEKVLDVVAASLTELFSADSTSISIYDFEAQQRKVVSIYAPYNEQVRDFIGYVAPLSRDRINSDLIKTGETFAISTPHEDERFDEGFKALMIDRGITAVLVTPLFSRAEVIGSIHISTSEDGRCFSDREITLAQTVAGQVAGILEVLRLLEQEQEQRELVERRNQELDAFAHSVAHDLKSPIALAASVAEHINLYVGDNGVEDLGEMAALLERTCFKSANIVDELLLLSGVRKQDVQVAEIDMKAVIEESLLRLEHVMKEYDDVRVLVANDWPTAVGYAPWIEEVWVNYISNALKYGGRPPRVRVGSTVQTNGEIRFWVRDNGGGVPEASRDHLFTEFSRLGQVQKIEGHGLGLSIVRRIMDKLNGRVGYRQLSKGGSEFYFVLPTEMPA